MVEVPTIPPEAIQIGAKAAYEAMHDPSGMTYVDTDTDDYSSVVIDGYVDLAHVTEAAIAAATPHLVGWQPIPAEVDPAKAPFDGLPILAFKANCGWEYFVCHWVEDRFLTLDSDYNPFSPALGGPTDYMSLPPPPAGSTT
jgi:hypothetical protein